MIEKINKYLPLSTFLVVVVVGVLVLVGGNNQSRTIGSGTRFPNGISADSTSPSSGQVRGTTLTITGASVLGSLATGASGTVVTQVLSGTCTLLGANLAQSSTTTLPYDCAVTGVVAGDRVFIDLPTTTPTTNLGWKLHGANASSTSGFITIFLSNFTGGTQSIAAGGNAGSNSWGSTTQFRIER